MKGVSRRITTKNEVANNNFLRNDKRKNNFTRLTFC